MTKKILNSFISILAFSLIFIAVLGTLAVLHTSYIWGDIYFEQIFIVLQQGITGIGKSVINSYIYLVLVPSLIITLLIIFFINSNRKLILLSLCLIIISLHKISFFEYLKNEASYTEIYKNEYVNPDKIEFKFPDKKKNLIVLYMESLEKDYANPKFAGINLLPNLTSLSETGTSFDGFIPHPTQNYTIASLVSGYCAVPYRLKKTKNFTDLRNFMPSLICYSDILKENGYDLHLLKSTNLTFARLGLFFESHGYDYIKGMEDFEEIYGYKLEDYQGTSWGYRDSVSYAIAKKELTKIAKNNKPFVFTMITLDTHNPDIYLDQQCSKTYNNAKDIILCADKMASDFIEWIKQQDFYDNTTIVIMGDHTVSGRNETYPKHNNRQIFNLITNSSANIPLQTSNRKWTHMDIAPTILNALGIEFNDGKFGLGRSLYSQTPTLYEKMEKKLFTELLKQSDEYNRFNENVLFFKDLYTSYPNYGKQIKGAENIKQYAAFSDHFINTVWLDTLSFTLPNKPQKDITLEIDFSILFMENNKRDIKIWINGTQTDNFIYPYDIKQPINQKITIPANLIKEDKKVKIEFRGDDLGSTAASVGVGVISFKIY